jgi:hypothetical protein
MPACFFKGSGYIRFSVEIRKNKMRKNISRHLHFKKTAIRFTLVSTLLQVLLKASGRKQKRASSYGPYPSISFTVSQSYLSIFFSHSNPWEIIAPDPFF